MTVSYLFYSHSPFLFQCSLQQYSHLYKWISSCRLLRALQFNTQRRKKERLNVPVESGTTVRRLQSLRHSFIKLKSSHEEYGVQFFSNVATLTSQRVSLPSPPVNKWLRLRFIASQTPKQSLHQTGLIIKNRAAYTKLFSINAAAVGFKMHSQQRRGKQSQSAAD